jgi:hypothetical protein
MIDHAADVALIKRYILHTTLLTVLDRDKKAIDASIVKIKEPYLEALEEAEKRALHVAGEIKKEMVKNGVKILEEKKTDYGTEVKYLARGYEGECKFWGGNMRAEVWVLINRYVFGKEE